MVNDFQGLPPIERTLGHILVPLVPLVSHIPRNGTEQDAGIKADFVPLLYRFVSAVSGAIQAIQPIHGRLSLENVDDFCSICSACSTHSTERNRTRCRIFWPMRADMKVDGADVDSGRWSRPLRVRSGRKRSKPVRYAKAPLTRFGSVLRGTVAPLRTPLMSAPLRDSSRRAKALWSETRGRSAVSP